MSTSAVPLRVVAFVLALLVVFSIAFVVGRAWGPTPPESHSPGHSDSGHGVLVGAEPFTPKVPLLTRGG